MQLAVGNHPFMTSTWRGRGQAQMDACGWGLGQLHVDVHTKNLLMQGS